MENEFGLDAFIIPDFIGSGPAHLRRSSEYCEDHAHICFPALLISCEILIGQFNAFVVGTHEGFGSVCILGYSEYNLIKLSFIIIH